MTFQLDAPLGYLSSNPDPSTKGTFTIPDGSTMGSISIVSYLRTFLVSALVCLVALKLGVPFVHGSGSLPVVGVAGLSIEFLLILFLVYRPRSLSVWGAGALFFLGTIVVNSLVPDFDCKCLGPIPVPRSIRVLLAGVLTVHFVIGFFLVKRWVSRKSEQSMRIRKMESLAGACMAILALCLVLILSDSDGKQDSHSVRVSNSNEPTQRSSVPPVRGGDVESIPRTSSLGIVGGNGVPGPRLEGLVVSETGSCIRNGVVLLIGVGGGAMRRAVSEGRFCLPPSVQKREVPTCVFVDSHQFVMMPKSVAWQESRLVITLPRMVQLDFGITDFLGRPISGVRATGNVVASEGGLLPSGDRDASVSDRDGHLSLRVPSSSVRRRILFSHAGYQEVVFLWQGDSLDQISIRMPRIFAFGYVLPDSELDLGVGFGMNPNVVSETENATWNLLNRVGLVPEPPKGKTLVLKAFFERRVVRQAWMTTLSVSHDSELLASNRVEVRPIHEGSVEIVTPDLANWSSEPKFEVTFSVSGLSGEDLPPRLPIRVRADSGKIDELLLHYEPSRHLYRSFLRPGRYSVVADPNPAAAQLGISVRFREDVDFFVPEPPALPSLVFLTLDARAERLKCRFVDRWGIPIRLRARVGGIPYGMVIPRDLVSEQVLFVHEGQRYSVIALNPENQVPEIILRDLSPPQLGSGGVWEIRIPSRYQE